MSTSSDLFKDGAVGNSYPIGSTPDRNGVNFSLFSRNCESVDLLLFNNAEDLLPSRIITLDPLKNRTYHYWHTYVQGIGKGQLYGYRVYGPSERHNGHRYDPGKVLLDPYSKAVAVPDGYNRYHHAAEGMPDTPSMKSVVADLSEYDWQGDQHPKRPFSQTVIYEMHVAGFTSNPNSGVDPDRRGRYAGLKEKIPYLTDLGVTAVELLPVFQFDSQDAPGSLINYWGYSPVSFFAPHQAYGTSKDPLKVLDEFRDMVREFHKAGMEVILDVVFNHTAEGGADGPTFCFKGIDNLVYYLLEPDKITYSNFTGTGNTLNANHPIVRRMIIDSLHFWVNEMHVDGFRFDLASILARDEQGKPSENPPVLWDIESDPMLAGTKLIAEAWDAAGLYQVGTFIGDSWREWNGKFRDDVRSFMRGDSYTISRFASRLIGSPDIYGKDNREAEQSINFITCHDGFTLNDLVTYNSKHNEANGEDNRDGADYNFSWNCGIEGPTDDPQVERLRNRQVKNFLALTILSVGAPMLLMGDEVRRTQEGNNNAYCHDDERTWFDWRLTERHDDIRRFVKLLLRNRISRDLSNPDYGMTLMQLMSRELITWHGVRLFSPDWSDHSHTIAFTARSVSGRMIMHFMINAYTESLDFEIPEYFDDRKCNWRRWIDTSQESPHDIIEISGAPVVTGRTCRLLPYSVSVLLDSKGH